MQDEIPPQLTLEKFSKFELQKVNTYDMIRNTIVHLLHYDYALVPISSRMSFKITVTFSASKLLINSILINSNGSPVIIPQAYKNIFINSHSINSENDMNIFFEFQNTHSLSLKMKMECKSYETITIETIKCIAKQLGKKMSSFYEPLEICGLLNRAGNKARFLKKSELEMRRSLIKLLLKKERSECDENRGIQIRKQKQSVIKMVKDIQQLKIYQNEEKKKGGFFQIEKKHCIIYDNQGQNKVDLAIKTLRKHKSENPYYKNKIKKQIEFVKRIIDPKHFLTYYFVEEKYNKLMLTYVKNNLDSYLDKNNSMTTKIDIFSQIIDAVQVLHQSGIVHRDLKPENILISQQNNLPLIKIIDFSQSLSLDKEYDEIDSKLIGCTVPYSPLECLTACKEGYNQKEIDIWSVGVILYQLMFGKVPVTYSKCFAQDINKGWKNSEQFSIFPRLYKRHGLRSLEQVFAYISLSTMKINPQERMPLSKIRKCLQKIQQFLHII